MSASLVEALSQRIVSKHNPKTSSINATVADILQHEKISDEGVRRVCAEVNRRFLDRLKASSTQTPLWSTRQHTAKPEQVLALLGREGTTQKDSSRAPGANRTKTSSVSPGQQTWQIELEPRELVSKLSRQRDVLWEAWRQGEAKPVKTSSPQYPVGMVQESGQPVDAKIVMLREFKELDSAIEKGSAYLYRLETDLTKTEIGYRELAEDMRSEGLTPGEVFKAVLSQARDSKQAAILVEPLLAAFGMEKQSTYDHRELHIRDNFKDADPEHPLLQSARELLNKTCEYHKASEAQKVLLNTKDYWRGLLQTAVEDAGQT